MRFTRADGARRDRARDRGLGAPPRSSRVTRQVITWLLVSLFLAMALNPAVDWFMRHGIKRRGLAVSAHLRARPASPIGAIGYAFIPTLVDQVNDFVAGGPRLRRRPDQGPRPARLPRDEVPPRREGPRAGRGGRCVEGPRALPAPRSRSRRASSRWSLATITIVFLTFFMLLEGPTWMERFYGLLPERSQPRWRKVGDDIYRTVGGYVTGNLADQPDRGHAHDGRAARDRASVRGRARPARRDPRPDPARRRDDRRHHRRDRRVPPLDHGRDRRRRASSSSTSSSRTTCSSRSSTARRSSSRRSSSWSRCCRRRARRVLGALGAIPVAGAIQVLLRRLAPRTGAPVPRRRRRAARGTAPSLSKS